MRPTDRFCSCQGSDFVIGELKPQCLESFNDEWVAAVPAGTQQGQTALERLIPPVEAIPQDMELTFAVKGADFHAGKYLDSELGPCLDRFGESVHDVVVRNGKRGDSGFLSESEDIGWSQASVRVRGMEMEVNAAHETALQVRIFSQPVVPCKQEQDRDRRRAHLHRRRGHEGPT